MKKYLDNKKKYFGKKKKYLDDIKKYLDNIKKSASHVRNGFFLSLFSSDFRGKYWGGAFFS
ncbi:MAG: hypothetical protein RL757_3144 [Bacteroidota bacterium]|jgi:hypothetical protein